MMEINLKNNERGLFLKLALHCSPAGGTIYFIYLTPHSKMTYFSEL